MPKQLLSGTLEEQCAFLYSLAQEKMAAGSYTGAVHALKEILKHAPDYPGAAELLARAQAAKREQSLLVICGFVGAIVSIGLGTWLGIDNDLWFLGLALVGAIGGYLVGLAVASKVRTPPTQSPP